MHPLREEIHKENFDKRQDRLKRLIEILCNVDSDNFDMTIWLTDQMGCGTVACAAGWACLDPEFQEKGLYYDKGVQAPVAKHENFHLSGYEALGYFFGLHPAEVDLVFNSSPYTYEDYNKPQAVIERIRKLLLKDVES